MVNNGLVSVIVPSRGRPEHLVSSISSLIRLSDHPELLEVLVGLDLDDIDSKNLPERLKSEFSEVNVRCEFFTRLGYDRLDEYWNALGLRSSGDWVLMWNDDAVMQSNSWDTFLRRSSGSLAMVVYPRVANDTLQTLFPVVSRSWLALFGRIAAWNHADSYIWRLVGPFGLWRREPRIVILHNRLPDLTTSEITYHQVEFPSNEFEIDRLKIRIHRDQMPLLAVAKIRLSAYIFTRVRVFRRWQKKFNWFPFRRLLNEAAGRYENF